MYINYKYKKVFNVNYYVKSTSETTVPETNTPSDPIYWLDRLSAILRHLVTKSNSEKDPCVVAVVEVYICFLHFNLLKFILIVHYVIFIRCGRPCQKYVLDIKQTRASLNIFVDVFDL